MPDVAIVNISTYSTWQRYQRRALDSLISELGGDMMVTWRLMFVETPSGMGVWAFEFEQDADGHFYRDGDDVARRVRYLGKTHA